MPKEPIADRKLVRLLSAAADVDTRTAARALTLGVDAIHGGKVREAILAGAASIGVTLPTTADE